MFGRQTVPDVCRQLGQLLRKIIRRGQAPIPLERKGCKGVAARRATDRQVDAIRIEAAQHAEHLGDLQRTVVRQHDAAAADSDAAGRTGDRGNQHFRRGRRQHRRAVMLRHPVAVKAPAIRESRQLDGPMERVPAGRTFGDWRLIEDAQTKGMGRRHGV